MSTPARKPPRASPAFDARVSISPLLPCPTPYSAAQSEPPAANVAKIGNVEYPTLGAAIAAVNAGEGGETIKLLADYTTTAAENLAFTKDATLDLGGFTLTVPTANLGKFVDKPDAFAVAAGASVTFQNGTIAQEAGGNRGLQVLGTVTVACTMTKVGNAAPVFDCYNGAVINVGNGANVVSEGDVFRTKGEDAANTLTLNITGGTFTSRPSPASGYDMFYFMKPNYTFNLNITGGTFNTGDNLINFGACANQANATPLTDACKAKFSSVALANDVSNFALVADGYEFVQGTDEYYTIAKIPSFTVTFTKNTTEAIGSTNVLRDTVLTADMIPEVSGGTWDVNPVGAIITSNTNFNYTVAVGPDWPSDWPTDVPPAMKEAFKTWADTYKVESFAGAENAFLLNADPKQTLPTLEITSIEVADGVATIKVSAGEKNLKDGINGVLFVSATDDLAGEWVTTEVETPKSYEDDGLTAVFEVEGAQFMKAKVGFKVETPVDKE